MTRAQHRAQWWWCVGGGVGFSPDWTVTTRNTAVTTQEVTKERTKTAGRETRGAPRLHVRLGQPLCLSPLDLPVLSPDAWSRRPC